MARRLNGNVGGYRIAIKYSLRQEMKIFTPGEREAGHSEKTSGVMWVVGG